MKKFMIFSLLAALACGAWADNTVKYYVRITRIDKTAYEETCGTLPGTVTLSLIDTGYDSTKTIYTRDISFEGMEVGIGGGETITLGKNGNYIREDGRFDIATLVNDHALTYKAPGTSAIYPDQGGMENGAFKFSDSTGKSGEDYGATIEFSGFLNFDNVYEKAMGHGIAAEEDLQDYAAENLVTVLKVGNATYTLEIDPSEGTELIKSSTDMTAFGPQPVPEPTSGLLLLMGLAGLALKRKQQAK